MRRLNLPLNNAEYALYTASLDDLAESHTTNDYDNRTYDDAYYDRLAVIGEARVWSRGAIHVSVSDINSVSLFYYTCSLRCSMIVLSDLTILSSKLGASQIN